MHPLKPLALALFLVAPPALAQDADAARRDAADAVRSLGIEDATFATVVATGGGLVATGVAGHLPATPGKAGAAPVGLRVRSLRLDAPAGEAQARSYGLATLDGVESGDVSVERIVVAGLAARPSPDRPRFSSLQGRALSAKAPDGTTVSVEGFRVANAAWADGLPTGGVLQVRGLSAKGGYASFLYALAPDLPRTVDIDVPVSVDVPAGRLGVEGASVWLGRSAKLSLDARLTGFSPEALRPSTGTAVPDLGGVRIASARLRLDDTGLAASLLALKARLEGVTHEEAAESTLRQAEAAYPRKAADPALRREALGALRAFLADPRSLTVEVAPPSGDVAPLALAGLYQGVGTARGLGLSVRANNANVPRKAAAARATSTPR